MLIRKQMGDSPVVGWKYGTSHQYFETFLFVWQIYKKKKIIKELEKPKLVARALNEKYL